jgi:hypothetical protein
MTRASFASWLLIASLAAGAADARAPVVVELYTAQGCASCGKANAFVASLADRAGVTALTFNVDYWDYLGWKDTFAQPEFDQRQRDYDKRFDLRDVYTPQIIVGGQAQASGDNQSEVESLIRAARRGRVFGPELTPRADGTVAVSASSRRVPKGGDDVWLVRYDPRTQGVLVKEGENKGQTVVHRNVVRQLVKLGTWNGRRRVYHPPATKEDGLATLILVQAPSSGRILSVLEDAARN